MRVLFVCTGNTCRSPMAKGIFDRIVKADGSEDRIKSDSAGLSVAVGSKASENAILACEEVNIDISRHRARKINESDIEGWDLYFAMTETHAYILEKAGFPSNKIYTANAVTDPFGGDLDVYRECRDKLEKEVKMFYNGVVYRLMTLKKNN